MWSALCLSWWKGHWPRGRQLAASGALRAWMFPLSPSQMSVFNLYSFRKGWLWTSSVFHQHIPALICSNTDLPLNSLRALLKGISTTLSEGSVWSSLSFVPCLGIQAWDLMAIRPILCFPMYYFNLTTQISLSKSGFVCQLLILDALRRRQLELLAFYLYNLHRLSVSIRLFHTHIRSTLESAVVSVSTPAEL